MADMRAVVQGGYGCAGDVLSLARRDAPRPGVGELVVEARASAVSPGDLFAVQGVPLAYRLALGARRPRQPVRGLVVAGVVAEVGPGVDGFTVGDEVCAEVSGGAFAEYVRVPAKAAAHKPANVGFAEAATVPLVGPTALQALRDYGHVGDGQRVLVTGASGGVGSWAVQIAVGMGAEVTAVCSGRHADFVRSLGASRAIDYETEDPAREQGAYDVVLDIAGRLPLPRLRRTLRDGGVLLLVSGEGGAWFGPLGRYARGLATSRLGRGRIRTVVARASGDDLAQVCDLVEAGRARPVIDSTFSLDQASDAVEHYAQRHACGKVAITV